MSALTNRLNEVKNKRDVAERIAAKLATGKFKDTGELYTADKAVADHSNTSLRMSASIDGNGKLEWK